MRVVVLALLGANGLGPNFKSSGRSDVARYQFKVADNLNGALHLTARVRYRRFTRVFSDYSLGKSVDYPIAPWPPRST